MRKGLEISPESQARRGRLGGKATSALRPTVMTLEQVAAILGISRSMVQKHEQNALRKMRAALESEDW